MDNAIIEGHPGVTFGLHICRGNNQSKFYAEGDYEPIARIFERTLFDRFLLEYDDARSGGFDPLRHLPEDRVAVLVPLDDEVVAAVLGHHLDNFGRQRLEVHIAGHDRTHGQ